METGKVWEKCNFGSDEENCLLALNIDTGTILSGIPSSLLRMLLFIIGLRECLNQIECNLYLETPVYLIHMSDEVLAKFKEFIQLVCKVFKVWISFATKYNLFAFLLGASIQTCERLRSTQRHLCPPVCRLKLIIDSLTLQTWNWNSKFK